MAKLTPKQKAFCDYYIELGNATEAAIKAGYSKKTAKETGYENLTKPHLESYIKERMAEKDAKRIAKQDEVLEFLTRVMRGELTEQVPVGQGEGYFELQDKDTYIKDRVKAAELLGKRHMLWTEKQQIEVVTPVFVDDVDEED